MENLPCSPKMWIVKKHVPGGPTGTLQAARSLYLRFRDPAETLIFSCFDFSSDMHVTCTLQHLLKALTLESHGMSCSD